MTKEIAVMLVDMRSALNVGSIFRTADAAGVSKVYLAGLTPHPVDRFGREQKEIAKVALGAQKFVPWEACKNPHSVIAQLRPLGWQIVAVEQSKGAIDYRTFKIKKPTLFVFGNEVRGLNSGILKQCDTVVEILMRGKKESLNVAVAAGIMLFSANT